MPRQLIYTSSPCLLDSGKTGFGTVARSRGIGTTLTRLLERISQLPRSCPQEDIGAIFSYRIIEIDRTRHYVLSRIVRAGSDYSGRANHLAHHLICSKEEVDLLMRHPATPTPAGLILALSAADFWKNKWTGTPTYLPDEFAFSARYLPDPAEQATWQDLTGHKRNALIPTEHPYVDGCFIVVPDSCDSATVLMLNHEADWLSPRRGWDTTFTTHLCSTDMVESFLRIYLHEGSTSADRMRRSRRPILRLHDEMPFDQELPQSAEEQDEALPIPDPPSTPILPDKVTPSAQTIALKPQRRRRHSDKKKSFALPSRPTRRRPRHIAALASVILLATGAAGGYYLFSSNRLADGNNATRTTHPVETPSTVAIPDKAPEDAPPPTPAPPTPPPAAPAPDTTPKPEPVLPMLPEATEAPSPLAPLQSQRDVALKAGTPLPPDLTWLLNEGRNNLQTADIAWIDLTKASRGMNLRSVSAAPPLLVTEENGCYHFERAQGEANAPLFSVHVKNGVLTGIETPEGHPVACSLTAENSEGIAVRHVLAPNVQIIASVRPEAPQEQSGPEQTFQEDGEPVPYSSPAGAWPTPNLSSRGADWYPALNQETRTYRFTAEQIYGSETLKNGQLVYATRPDSPLVLPILPDLNRQGGEERFLVNSIILPNGWDRHSSATGEDDTDGDPDQVIPTIITLSAQMAIPVDQKAAAENLVDRIVNKNLGGHDGPDVSLAYIYHLVWSIHEKHDEQALTKYLNLFVRPKPREYLRKLLGETPRQHRGNQRTHIAPPLTLPASDARNRIARRRVATELRKPEATERILAALRADMQRRLVEATRSLPQQRAHPPHLTLVLTQLNFHNGKLVWIFKPASSPESETGGKEPHRPHGEPLPLAPASSGRE